ncbi:MAG: nucleotidyltransferase family protein [bacterium]
MNMLNRTIIISRLISNSEKIREFGVEKVGLFGSYLMDQQKETIDIDILVEFQEGKNSFDNFINLCFLLDDLFSGTKVEVVTTNSLSPYIGPKILKQVEDVPLSA